MALSAASSSTSEAWIVSCVSNPVCSAGSPPSMPGALPLLPTPLPFPAPSCCFWTFGEASQWDCCLQSISSSAYRLVPNTLACIILLLKTFTGSSCCKWGVNSEMWQQSPCRGKLHLPACPAPFVPFLPLSQLHGRTECPWILCVALTDLFTKLRTQTFLSAFTPLERFYYFQPTDFVF